MGSIHYGSITGDTQPALCLRLLREAGSTGLSAFTLAERVGTLALHSVIAEIRPQIEPFGERILNRLETVTLNGRKRCHSWYTLVSDAGKQMEMAI